jgi:hypothetical protein
LGTRGNGAEVVHYGLAEQVIEARQSVLDPAYKVELPPHTLQLKEA